MEFAELISAAKARFGNHSEVARALGMTPRAYRDIRSPERTAPPPARLVICLRLLLQMAPVQAAMESVCVMARSRDEGITPVEAADMMPMFRRGQ